jgi:heme/copper-type cytochrome/quinol oxidase subunit 4
MKSTTLRQVYIGTIGDMKNLEQHYSDMAAKGWMIDKIGSLTHRYRAIEPSKRCFFVDLLPQITAFDYPENENAQEYRRICEESGWSFIAANKQFHVFCADGENDSPIPIHTDHGIHAKIYLKACRKYELPAFLFILFFLWFLSPMGNGAEVFLSNILLYQAIGYFCFLPGYVWTFASVIRWYLRTRESAKNDLPMPVVRRRVAKLRNYTLLAGFALFLICTILGVVLEIAGGMSVTIGLIVLIPLLALGVGFWIRKQIDTRRRTRAGNIGLTVAALIIMEIIILGGTVWAIMNMPFSADAESRGSRPALTLKAVGDRSPLC